MELVMLNEFAKTFAPSQIFLISQRINFPQRRTMLFSLPDYFYSSLYFEWQRLFRTVNIVTIARSILKTGAHAHSRAYLQPGSKVLSKLFSVINIHLFSNTFPHLFENTITAGHQYLKNACNIYYPWICSEYSRARTLLYKRCVLMNSFGSFSKAY